MRTLVRWAIGVMAIIHGVVHLLGVAEGFGWADVSELTEPIGTGMGLAWLAACVMSVAAGVLLIAGVARWWVAAAVASVGSEAVILTSWTDAKAGTLANVVVALAAGYGFRAAGPTSYRARFQRLAKETAAATMAGEETDAPVVTEADLAHLPAPVADYVRTVGAVGRPRVRGFRAEISGRIRGGPDKPWMRWSGAQVNTFGAEPSRVLFMDATMSGVPADVLHAYVGPHATMQVRVASLVKIVDARGPDMDQAETVTLLNDLCILAPAALVDAPIAWSPIDGQHARATFTNAGHTVSAVVTFDHSHQLVDFVSDDRLRSSGDGKTFTLQRWTTPVTDYRSFEGRSLATVGRGCWHPDGEPGFAYLEFHVDDITYLEGPPGTEEPSSR